MDLSDTLVTTRKIMATLSPDEIKAAAIGAVRLKAGLSALADVFAAEATIEPDGTVRVSLGVNVPAPVIDPAPAVDAPPALVPPLALPV